ncbi:MAG TPA: PmoA family protein [bacterium]|nr:PmoA family protein [bacterium]
MEIIVKNCKRKFYNGIIKFDFDGEGIYVDKKENIYFQVDEEEKKMFFIDEFEENEEKNLNLEKIENSPEIVKVVENTKNEEVNVFINEELFTTYHYSEKVTRPFLNPVIGPDGKSVVRPPASEGNTENFDHIHHRGILVAHGDVNGTDNWSEEEGHGKTIHKKFISLISGPVFGKIHSLSDWVNNKGNKILQEERIITIYNLPKNIRIIDHKIILKATEGEVVFKDTKESGLLSIRVYPSMEVRNGGTMKNSYGAIGEEECWGKRANWCDYYGKIDETSCGISVFDFTENLRYPTYWHIRDYGLFTANFFGISDFSGDKRKSGTYILPAYQDLKLLHRIYIHSGTTEEGKVKEMYLNFIYPPKIEIK